MQEFRTSRAVLVAISRYETTRWNLKTPVDDATKLADVLRAQHGFSIEELYDANATIDGIRTHLAGLKNALDERDRMLFYFAGHGLSASEDGQGARGYILPHDARDDGSKLLPMEELDGLLSELRCRHMLVVLDCCFAGAYRWSNKRNVVIPPANLNRKRYQWFVEDPAWQAIASAASDEEAVDTVLSRTIGKRIEAETHSPFAAALIAGLEGAADIAPEGGDGIITATELFLHVETTLFSGSADGESQKPVLWPLEKHAKGQYVFKTPGREIDLPEAPELDPAANPWRGDEPYGRADRKLLSGRRYAAEDLLGKVLAQRLTVLSGASGSGKTSLIEAGLLWRTEAHDILSVVLAPGADPFASLADALREAAPDAPAPPSADRLRTEPGALAAWAAKHGRPLLLVIDRMEDLLRSPPEEIALFAGLLREALDKAEPTAAPRQDRERAVAVLEAQGYLGVVSMDQGRDGSWWAWGRKRGDEQRVEVRWPQMPLRILLVARSGFEDGLAAAFGKEWPDDVFRLDGMSPADLRRVVEEPASVRAMRFESDDLVDDIAKAFVDMPGALPLLSAALHDTYLRYLASRDDDRILKRAHYQPAKGGIEVALAERADKVVDAAGEATARRVLGRLVARDAGRWVRRRASLAEFDYRSTEETEAARALIDRLVESRLAVRDRAGRGAYLELAHDALIVGWPRLQSWLEADKTAIADLGRLAPAAEQWRRAGDAHLWTGGAQLDSAVRLLSADYPRLNDLEERFALESARRARNRSLRLGLLTAFALSGLVAAGWYSINLGIQKRRANAEQVTRNWIQTGNSVSAAAFVTDLMERDPQVRSEELRWSLTRAMHEAGERVIVAHDARSKQLQRLHVEPKGLRFVVATSRSVRGWGRNGKPLFETLSSTTKIVASDVAWNTQRIVTAEAGEVVVSDWGGGGAQVRFQLGEIVRQVAFDEAESAVLALGEKGLGCVWSLKSRPAGGAGGGCTAPLKSPAGLAELAWRPKSAELVGIDYTGRLNVWRYLDGTVTGHSLHESGEAADNVYPRQIAVAPNGETALTWVDHFGLKIADSDKIAAVLWDLTKSQPEPVQLADVSKIGGAVFAPSSRYFAIRSDKAARVFDVQSAAAKWRGRPATPGVYSHLAALVGHNSYIRDIRFSADGETIVTASDDHALRLWDARTGEPRATMKGHTQPVRQAHLTDDGCFAISTADDRSARVWARAGAWNERLSERPCDGKQRKREFHATALRFGASGALVVSADSDGHARIWDAAQPGSRPVRLEGRPANRDDQALALAISSGSEWLAVGGGPPSDDDKPGWLMLYKRSPDAAPNAFRLVATLALPEQPRSLDFSGASDALRLVVARGKGKATIMRVVDGKLEPVRTLEPPPAIQAESSDTLRITRAAWSADGSRIAGAVKAGSKGYVCLWEHAGSGAEPAGGSKPRCRKLTAEPQGLAWGRSGRRLAASDGNAYLYVWADADREDVEKVQLPDDNYAPEIAFVGDDLVAARLRNHTLFMRSLSLGREVYERRLPERPAALAVHPMGRLLATAHVDGSIHLMALPDLDDMIAQAKRDLPRCLDGSEWLRYQVGDRTSSGEVGRPGSDGRQTAPAWCRDKWPSRAGPAVMGASGVAAAVSGGSAWALSATAR